MGRGGLMYEYMFNGYPVGRWRFKRMLRRYGVGRRAMSMVLGYLTLSDQVMRLRGQLFKINRIWGD